MKHSRKVSLALLLTGLSVLPVLAQAQWFLQATGSYLAFAQQNSDVDLGPDGSTPPMEILENYSSNKMNTVIGYSLGLGYRTDLTKFDLGQYVERNEISLNYQQNTALKIQGAAMRADVQHIDNNYQYTIDSNVALVEDRLYFRVPYSVKPFFIAGAGFAQLSAHNFTSQGIAGSTSVFENPYGDQSQTNFAFEAGLGLAADLGKNVSLSIAYRYVDLGTIETGPALYTSNSAATKQTLEGLNYHMQSNNVTLGLNLYF
jgi:opacity protein-like surface antigen